MQDFEFETENRKWNYEGYIVRQQLIDTRGWCPVLIDEFLEPDLIETNPHNPCQNMRLYKSDKVFTIENSNVFKYRFLEINSSKFDSLKYAHLPQIKRKIINELNKERRKRNQCAFKR